MACNETLGQTLLNLRQTIQSKILNGKCEISRATNLKKVTLLVILIARNSNPCNLARIKYCVRRRQCRGTHESRMERDWVYEKLYVQIIRISPFTPR